jgi:cyclohexanecarboxylate-CoA ligase
VVVVRDGASLSFDDMVAHLESREIARQKIPERLEVRPGLPRTASGKVKRGDLRAELAREP